jgi:hypothetical protein
METGRSGSAKPPIWFWVSSVAALLWFLLGLGALVSLLMQTPEMLASMPEAQRTLYQDLPAWTNILLGAAMATGMIGAVLLLIRRRPAVALFVVSLLTTLAHDVYWFAVHRAHEIAGPTAFAFPGLVLVVIVLLIILARFSSARQWIS